jgi:hypothetical protein
MTTALTPTDAGVTRTCQPGEFTATGLIAALEAGWAAIRTHHPEIPPAVIVVASGSPAKPKAGDAMKWGHFASLRWQHGPDRLNEVLVSGEGLSRTPDQILTTLLHEAAHALADVRHIQDTSRQGRWHNKHFAALAMELGLTPEKDPKIGWSPCTLRAETTTRYQQVLDDLTDAISAYRHPEPLDAKTRTSNNNGVTAECGCPRKIRCAASVLAEGPILCGVCQQPFLSDDEDTSDNPGGSS